MSQIGELNGSVVRIITLAFFKILMVTLTSTVSLEMQYCFCSSIFLGRDDSCGFHLSFSHHRGRESMCEFCQIYECAVLLSHVRLFVTPWTVAHQAPLSKGVLQEEYWSGLPCLPPGDIRLTISIPVMYCRAGEIATEWV